MAQISFKLPVFEGPLDLLLHLIAKHKLNINDIEISKLLEQYLLYIEQCSEQDYELAGEFLEMAARLIYIKTVSLLPSPEEAEAVKKELEGALIEYSLCKLAAAELAKRDIGDCIFVRRQMPVQIDPTYRHQHEPEVLRQAYLQIGAKPQPNAKAPLTDRIQAVVQQRIRHFKSSLCAAAAVCGRLCPGGQPVRGHDGSLRPGGDLSCGTGADQNRQNPTQCGQYGTVLLQAPCHYEKIQDCERTCN